MNETDIREEIIAQLLRILGYKRNTPENIRTEKTLNYPQIQMGRKKPNKDAKLRGKADYILEVDSKFRWVIEAKAGSHLISKDDIQQAFSYANHPEVKAIFFVVTNGVELRVYKTNHGPEVEPVLHVNYENLEEQIDRVKELLSPNSIRFTYSEPTITNALDRESFRIESLDNRVKVDGIDVIDGVPLVQISSKDPLDPLEIRFSTTGKEATQRLNDFKSYGGDLSLSEDEWEALEIPKCFENGLGELVIGTEGIRTGMVVLRSESNADFFLSLSGSWSVGLEGARFKSLEKGCPLKIQIDLRHEELNKGSLNLQYDLSEWAGSDMRMLPHFAELLQWANLCNEGCDFQIITHVEGSKLGNFEQNSDVLFPKFVSIFKFIKLQEKCSYLLKIMNAHVLFTKAREVEKSASDILNAYELKMSSYLETDFSNENLGSTFSLSKGDKSEFADIIGSTKSYRFSDHALEFDICGQQLIISGLTTEFRNIIITMESSEIHKLELNEAIKVRVSLIGLEGSKKIYFFNKEIPRENS